MGKNKTIDKNIRQLIKWECVRRNSKYITSFNKKHTYDNIPSHLLLNPKISVVALKKIDPKRILMKSEPIEKRLEILGILDFLGHIDSGRPIEKLGIIEERKDIFWYFDKKKLIFFNLKNIKNKKITSLSALKRTFNNRKVNIKNKDDIIKFIPHHINIGIDLGYTKKEILADFEEKISRWFKLLNYLGLKSKKRSPDYNIILRYLRIYDSVEQIGKKWGKLANIFYKSDVERGDINYAKRKITRDYERGKKLIDGGYRQIR